MTTVAEKYESEVSEVKVNGETGLQNGHTRWSSSPSSESIGNQPLAGNRTIFKAHCGYCKVSTKPHWRQTRERRSLGQRAEPST